MSEGHLEIPCSFENPMDDCYSFVSPSQDWEDFELPWVEGGMGGRKPSQP